MSVCLYGFYNVSLCQYGLSAVSLGLRSLWCLQGVCWSVWFLQCLLVSVRSLRGVCRSEVPMVSPRCLFVCMVSTMSPCVSTVSAVSLGLRSLWCLQGVCWSVWFLQCLLVSVRSLRGVCRSEVPMVSPRCLFVCMVSTMSPCVSTVSAVSLGLRSLWCLQGVCLSVWFLQCLRVSVRSPRCL